MKKTYVYSTPLWLYFTELPIMLIMTLAIVHNPTATGWAKLYPLIFLCGAAIIFINIFLFRAVRFSMAEVRDIGLFSNRDDAALRAGASIRLVPTKFGRVRVYVYGDSGLPELDWMRDQTTNPDEICMFRSRVEGGERGIRRVLSYFGVGSDDIKRIIDEVGFHGEYEECDVDTLTDVNERKEYRITLKRTLAEFKISCDELTAGMELTARKNSRGEWDIDLTRGQEHIATYRSRKVKKQFTNILNEFEASGDDIREFFSGEDVEIELDLIYLAARSTKNGTEYKIRIK